MYQNALTTAAFVVFALFATPSMSSADNQPIPSVLEGQTIEVARDGEVKQVQTRKITGKRPQTAETAEGVDCFYDSNKFNLECSDSKSSQQ